MVPEPPGASFETRFCEALFRMMARERVRARDQAQRDCATTGRAGPVISVSESAMLRARQS